MRYRKVWPLALKDESIPVFPNLPADCQESHISDCGRFKTIYCKGKFFTLVDIATVGLRANQTNQK